MGMYIYLCFELVNECNGSYFYDVSANECNGSLSNESESDSETLQMCVR